MAQDTLNTLLLIAEDGDSIKHFDPQPVLDLWIKLSELVEKTGDTSHLEIFGVQLPNIFTTMQSEKNRQKRKHDAIST